MFLILRGTTTLGGDQSDLLSMDEKTMAYDDLGATNIWYADL